MTIKQKKWWKGHLEGWLAFGFLLLIILMALVNINLQSQLAECQDDLFESEAWREEYFSRWMDNYLIPEVLRQIEYQSNDCKECEVCNECMTEIILVENSGES